MNHPFPIQMMNSQRCVKKNKRNCESTVIKRNATFVNQRNPLAWYGRPWVMKKTINNFAAQCFPP